jgi:hypothetical protein
VIAAGDEQECPGDGGAFGRWLARRSQLLAGLLVVGQDLAWLARGGREAFGVSLTLHRRSS